MKIQFGDLSILDLAALAYFVIAWLGYAPFIRWQERRRLGVGVAMVDHRRDWMDALLGRDMKVADTAIVGHIMSTASFFASTTVIVIAALLGVLINAGKSAQGNFATWLAIPMPNELQIKIGLVVVIAYYAFQMLHLVDPASKLRCGNDGCGTAGSIIRGRIAPTSRCQYGKHHYRGGREL